MKPVLQAMAVALSRDCDSRRAMTCRSSSTLAQKAAMTAELRSTNRAKVSVMRSLMSLK